MSCCGWQTQDHAVLERAQKHAGARHRHSCLKTRWMGAVIANDSFAADATILHILENLPKLQGRSAKLAGIHYMHFIWADAARWNSWHGDHAGGLRSLACDGGLIVRDSGRWVCELHVLPLTLVPKIKVRHPGDRVDRQLRAVGTVTQRPS